MLQNKKILLGISGGIAAYKTPELIRLLVKYGAKVRVIATQNALEFVTALTLETVSQHAVYSNIFATQGEYSTEHVSLADWADCMIVAPATANIIGKMATGIADDALSTAFLAFDQEIFIAPAMNVRMYNTPIVQANLKRLQEVGIHIIEPTEGPLACGVSAKGRMEEPSELVNVLIDHFTAKPLWGKKVLITAGPTYEKIDPVRFIGNYSSGKMGYALAETCALQGAQVTLVSGPVQLKTHHKNIRRINTESAQEMYDATTGCFAEQDAAILCAAVADFTPTERADVKIKREKDDLSIVLKPTQDIAAELGRRKTEQQTLIGFALETNNECANAQSKMERKNLDYIVLNSLQDANACFGYDTNKICIFSRNEEPKNYPLKSKDEVARDIVELLSVKH